MTSVEFLLHMDSKDHPGASHHRAPTLAYTQSKDKHFVSLEDCKLHFTHKFMLQSAYIKLE